MPVRRLREVTQKDSETQVGTVIDFPSSGEIAVKLSGRSGRVVLCDFLSTTSGEPPELNQGDRVLVVIPQDHDGKPIVLGKVAGYRRPDRRKLVVAADEELTLRCGEATIAIRKNGRILIKGVDIVTHARQRNRIRGGSIQLN